MQWNVNVELENRWNHLKKKERETDIKRLLNFNYITFMRYGDCFFLSSYSKFKFRLSIQHSTGLIIDWLASAEITVKTVVMENVFALTGGI